jgi:multiple sugar transport system substrate-binding protein
VPTTSVVTSTITTPKSEINWKKYAGTTIKILALKAFLIDYQLELLPDFEKLTGIHVEVEQLPEDQVNQKATIEMAGASSSYDIYSLWGHSIVSYVSTGALEPISSFVKNPEIYDPDYYRLDDIIPAALDLVTFKNEIWGIPIQAVYQQTLYYRKDLFEKYGIDKPPRTFDELKQVAEKLTKRSEDQYGFAGRACRGTQSANVWLYYLYGFGGKIFDDKWEPILNGSEGVESLKFYVELLNKCAPPGVSEFTWTEVQNSFMSGKVAMINEVINWASIFIDPSKSKFANVTGIALPPAGPAGSSVGVYSWVWAINKYSKNKEAAWLWLLWTTAPSQALYWSRKLGVPGRLSILNNPIFKEGVSKWYDGKFLQVLSELPKYAYPNYYPKVIPWLRVMDRIGVAVNEAVSGVKTPQLVLDEAAKDVRKIMEEAGYYR